MPPISNFQEFPEPLIPSSKNKKCPPIDGSASIP